MSDKYKVWVTQGQGCGEFPEAEYDTLDEALLEAQKMWGDGSVGIELPDGSWYEFDERWKLPANIVLLRMRKNVSNPRQMFLYGEWEKICPKSMMKHFQTGGHTFEEIWSNLHERLGWGKANTLFFEALAWGLFDIFEISSCLPASDKLIDYVLDIRKGLR